MRRLYWANEALLAEHAEQALDLDLPRYLPSIFAQPAPRQVGRGEQSLVDGWRKKETETPRLGEQEVGVEVEIGCRGGSFRGFAYENLDLPDAGSTLLKVEREKGASGDKASAMVGVVLDEVEKALVAKSWRYST